MKKNLFSLFILFAGSTAYALMGLPPGAPKILPVQGAFAYSGQALFLPYGQGTLLEVFVAEEIGSVHASNEAIRFEVDAKRKQISIRWVDAVPCVLTITGEAGVIAETLLVPDTQAHRQPTHSASPSPAKNEHLRVSVHASPAWSPFGAYVDRLVDGIHDRCVKIFADEGVNPAPGTVVTVNCRCGMNGQIQIMDVDGFAGPQAERICVAAVTALPPQAWTKDMVEKLGKYQDFSIVFTHR